MKTYALILLSGLSFSTKNRELTSYKISCRKMKEDHLTGKVNEKKSVTFKTMDCGKEAVAKSIKMKEMKEMGQIVYEITLGCEGVELPKPAPKTAG